MDHDWRTLPLVDMSFWHIICVRCGLCTSLWVSDVGTKLPHPKMADEDQSEWLFKHAHGNRMFAPGYTAMPDDFIYPELETCYERT